MRGGWWRGWHAAGRAANNAARCIPPPRLLSPRASPKPIPRLSSHACASTAAPVQSAVAPSTPPPATTRAGLARMRVADLRALAAASGLPTAGLKADLVTRLVEEGGQPTARGVAAQAAATTAPPPAPAAPATPPDPAAADTGLAVTWLGTSSGAPTPGRNVSSVAVRCPRAVVLIDAGEGTAVQLASAGVPLAHVGALLITHLHGDHCFGVHSVVAAVTSARAAAAAIAGVDPPPRLLVAGPPGLHALVLAGLKLSSTPFPTPLLVVELTADPGAGARPARARGVPGPVALATLAPDDTPAARAALAAARQEAAAAARGGGDHHRRGRRGPTPVVGLTWTLPLGTGGLTAVAAQLQHRVPSWGYSLREPAASGGRNVVILGDTASSAAIARAATNCDLLSHEATFAAPMAAKAAMAQHSTAAAAGAFAGAVGARRLVLTHFSGRYDVGPSASSRGGGRRDRGVAWSSDSDDSDGPIGVDAPQRAIEALVSEARRSLVRGGGGGARGGGHPPVCEVLAARDLMTVTVPRRPEGGGVERAEAVGVV